MPTTRMSQGPFPHSIQAALETSAFENTTDEGFISSQLKLNKFGLIKASCLELERNSGVLGKP